MTLVLNVTNLIYSATDMQLIPLELVKSNRDSVRKAREAYLIERGQTLEPHGLNKNDETLVPFFCISFLCLGHLYYLQLFITTFQAVTFSHNFKFFNF